METAVLLLLSFLLATLVAGIRRVPESKAYSLHRRGRFKRVMGPGWHLTLPVFDQVAHEVDLIGHRITLQLPEQFERAEVFFQIVEPLRVGPDLDHLDGYVQRVAAEDYAAVSGRAINEPRILAASWKEALNLRLRALGLQVTRCQLT